MTPQRLQELKLQRLDLLCAYLYYVLREESLENAPVILMGYRAVARSAILRNRQTELLNLRRCCKGLSTLAALRAAAVRYNDKADESGRTNGFRFEINEKTLAFKPTYDLLSGPLQEALKELGAAHAPPPHDFSLPIPDEEIYLEIAHDGERKRFVIDGVPSVLPSPAQHGRNGPRREAVSIPWSHLVAEAEEMDRIDFALGVTRPGNWAKRLLASSLKLLDAGVNEAGEPTITLKGIKHLIGLPGSGKTTLLVCLLRYLGARAIKTAVFFPSIEVCRQYLEDLRRYGVHAGLLVGQSRETKKTHAFKLAESLASNDSLRGFGRTINSAPLFEGVCALPRLTKAPAEVFSVETQLCRYVMQKRTVKTRKGEKQVYVPHLCPAWSVCSKNRAARELPNTSVWLGHIRSADTRVPVHTTKYNERYFDLIARDFDVVIFDEADNAQQALDMYGISQLKLSGYDTSFHREVQQSTLQVLAMGANARLRDENIVEFSLDSAEFEKLNIMLLSAIHSLDDDSRKSLAGLLLTPLRIIGDWLTPRKISGLSPELAYKDPKERAKEALAYVWERAAIGAFQFRRETKSVAEDGENWRAKAEALQVSLEKLADDAAGLQTQLAVWLNAPSSGDRSRQEQAISQILSAYIGATDSGVSRLIVRLLIAVTFTVLSYRRLVYRLEALAQEGAISGIRVDERCSDELLIACPDNLMGSLSGVRFFTDLRVAVGMEKERDIQLQYIVFSGAPRAFMYRLHEWVSGPNETRDGPAVLLTSATSYLPDSPAFHVDVPPTYLLQRDDHIKSAQNSQYEFRPIADPNSSDGEHLRFSGVRAKKVRDDNLRKMAAALLAGGATQSRVALDCAKFDVKDGIARKAAFIVNSYEQCLDLKQYIDQRFSAWRDRTIAVVKEVPEFGGDRGYVTAGMVESLGDSTEWDLLIFPMGALGRGTNIVFSGGARQRDATIGTLYFLTRPHPSPDDLGFLVSLGAQATMDFDNADLASVDRMDELSDELARARGKLYGKVGQLLRRPLYARSLGKLFRPFTANIAVPLLQTIGRAMRNGCPAQCFFVDRAWAENSSLNKPDTEMTSMLVQLRAILESGATSEDKTQAYLFNELYGPFLDGLRNVVNLKVAGTPTSDESHTEEGWVSPLCSADSPVHEEE